MEAEGRIRVLVVDDEPAIREYLELGLVYEGFEVALCGDGDTALHLAQDFRPHAVILDVRLPGADGFSLAAALRGDGGRVLIFLTARDEVDDRVRGMELGADDYLVKPFAFRELLARLRRHLERAGIGVHQVLRHGPIAVDLGRHQVTVGDREVHLSVREFDLLTCLLRHQGRVLPKRTLLDQVWGYDFYGDDNVVEVYVSYLRGKLGPEARHLVETVRGTGYRLG